MSIHQAHQADWGVALAHHCAPRHKVILTKSAVPARSLLNPALKINSQQPMAVVSNMGQLGRTPAINSSHADNSFIRLDPYQPPRPVVFF